MPDTGTFTTYPALVDLPPLVRKQRRLEARILPLAPLVEDEKNVRKAIDALLLSAGLTRGDSVTCNGYDVTHTGRAGTTSLSADALAILLVLGGVDPEFVDFALRTSTETGEAPVWATVKPSKGSQVRRPPATRPRRRG